MQSPDSLANLTRRRFIQVGGLGTLLGLPDLLRARSPGALDSGRGREKSCLFVFLHGGPPHLDLFDLKPNAPEEIRGPYKPIATSVPGLQFGELLPRLARQADKLALIRSMSHKEAPDHGLATNVLMRGSSNGKAETKEPYFGSVLAKLRPASRQVPSYVWLPKMPPVFEPYGYHTGGFLGPNFAPMLVDTMPQDFRFREFDPPRGISAEQALHRQQLLSQLDPASHPLAQTPAGSRYQGLRERAYDLLSGPQTRQAFDLDREPLNIRQRYGQHPLGENLLRARRLIEAGTRLVTVKGWVGLPPGVKEFFTGLWDLHGNNEQGNCFSADKGGLPWSAPMMDQAVAALLDDLAERGLLESTLVIIGGEFGRSPKVSSQPAPGRDHWPACFSMLLAGAGIRGGAVHGASDKHGAYVKDRLVTPEDFGATVYHALGVPVETRLAPDGATRPVSAGQPIGELFG
ncbi:MAG: DUF1501 domain-containing protein [Planctomycetia bacterium]|nr:DUF1501 domain-containing protein [Planctomycetia bacterium]